MPPERFHLAGAEILVGADIDETVRIAAGQFAALARKIAAEGKAGQRSSFRRQHAAPSLSNCSPPSPSPDSSPGIPSTSSGETSATSLPAIRTATIPWRANCFFRTFPSRPQTSTASPPATAPPSRPPISTSEPCAKIFPLRSRTAPPRLQSSRPWRQRTHRLAFPHRPTLHERQRLVVADHVEEVNSWRVTLTAPGPQQRRPDYLPGHRRRQSLRGAAGHRGPARSRIHARPTHCPRQRSSDLDSRLRRCQSPHSPCAAPGNSDALRSQAPQPRNLQLRLRIARIPQLSDADV